MIVFSYLKLKYQNITFFKFVIQLETTLNMLLFLLNQIGLVQWIIWSTQQNCKYNVLIAWTH